MIPNKLSFGMDFGMKNPLWQIGNYVTAILNIFGKIKVSQSLQRIFNVLL